MMRIVKTIATMMAGLAVGAVSLAHAATQAPVVPSTGMLGHASAADLAPAQTRNPVYGVAIRSSAALPSLETLPAGPSMADAFGHDFTADLDGLLWSDSVQTYAPFAGVMRTGFGTVMASGYAVRTTTPYPFAGALGGSDYHRYSLRDFQLAMAVMPGVTLRAGYRAEMAGRLNGYDAFGSPAYDGLFFSAAAVNSPYLSLVNGGDYLQTSIRIADGLDLHFGVASLDPQQAEFAEPVSPTVDRLRTPQHLANLRQAQATEAGVSWNFAPWGGLGVSASNITERNSLLGDGSSDALSTLRSAKTTAIGLTARFGFGAGWVTTISYNEGITKLNLQPNAAGASGDTLHSHAYGIAVAKHGLFGKSDSLGLALTRPVQVYNGGVNLTPLPRADLNRALGLGSEHLLLAGATPETDVELGYTTTFFDGALALQANAGYQMNYAGQSGTNAVTVLSRAKINF